MNDVERVHTMGDDGNLVGIVTLPPGDDGSARSTPFLVLLNAGLVHRIGPFRMSVQLARRIARKGCRVLRFDQAGLGDSAPRSQSTSTDILLDAQQAFDFLSHRYGASRFIVGGLCSGAMNAHRVALADPRVTGVILLDGYAWPTLSWYADRVLGRLRRPSTWHAFASRSLGTAKRHLRDRLSGRATSIATEPEVDPRQTLFYQDWPPRSEVRADIDRIVGRGARMLFVYTGGWSSFVHPRQFDEMFPRLAGRERITVTYHPSSDHTYLLAADRDAMLRDVETFVVMTTSGDAASELGPGPHALGE